MVLVVAQVVYVVGNTYLVLFVILITPATEFIVFPYPSMADNI